MRITPEVSLYSSQLSKFFNDAATSSSNLLLSTPFSSTSTIWKEYVPGLILSIPISQKLDFITTLDSSPTNRIESWTGPAGSSLSPNESPSLNYAFIYIKYSVPSSFNVVNVVRGGAFSKPLSARNLEKLVLSDGADAWGDAWGDALWSTQLAERKE